MSGIIDVIERLTPVGSRIARVLDFLLPLLIAALLVTTLMQVGRVSKVADEAKANSEANTVLIHRVGILVGRVAKLTHDLHSGLVDSCKQNGNPLRRIVRERIERELAQTTMAEIEEFFPSLTRHRLEVLLHTARRNNAKDIKELKPVHCKTQYR